MLRAYCPKGLHYPEYLIASIPADLDPDRIGVLVYNNGNATNRWADGTVGMTQEQQDFADTDESPVCSEHLAEIEWEHAADPVEG